MSDFRFRRLERFALERRRSTMKLGIPLPKTSGGKVDRDCPSPRCETRRFQIGGSEEPASTDPAKLGRMHRPRGTPGMTCPYCGHDDADDAFTTREDRRAAAEDVKWAATEDIAEAFGSMLESAFRGSKHVQVKRSYRPPRPQPRTWREDLLRELCCGACGRRYGVYAFALFCPDCGAANVTEHFSRENELVEHQLGSAESCTDPERRFRTLCNALEDLVTALESALRAVYVHIVTARCAAQDAERRTSKGAIGNRFQNIERGTDAFSEFGIDPYSALAEPDRIRLGLALAKRHVVTHNQGMVDAAFVRHTGTGSVGRPVQISPAEIRDATELIAAVLADLERTCPELAPVRRATVVPPSVP